MLWAHRQRGRRVKSKGNLRKSRTQKCHSVEENADIGENEYLVQIRCFEMVNIGVRGERSPRARRENSLRGAGAGWELPSIMSVIAWPTFRRRCQNEWPKWALEFVFWRDECAWRQKWSGNRRQGQPYLSNKKRIEWKDSFSGSEWKWVDLVTFES